MRKKKDKVIYYVTISDIQEVADQMLERDLTSEEVELIQDKVGDYINWYDAIELAINEKIQSGEIIDAPNEDDNEKDDSEE